MNTFMRSVSFSLFSLSTDVHGHLLAVSVNMFHLNFLDYLLLVVCGTRDLDILWSFSGGGSQLFLPIL